MGHHIHGFIAQLGPLGDTTVGSEKAVVLPLTQGFGFMPVMQAPPDSAGPWPFAVFERLTLTWTSWAAEQSQLFPLAYIETDYFGGLGMQAAIAWQAGRIKFGPEQSKSEWVNGQFSSTPLLDSAINHSLRLIGVVRGTHIDEFEALGLGQYRSDEDWLASSGMPLR
jgi:hypothetical protein